MNAKIMFLGLAPWALFSALTERIGAGSVGFAALLACVSSSVLAIRGAKGEGGVKIIDATGVVTFGVIALLGFIGESELDQTLADFGRGGATLVLSAVMGISVLTVPFTEQYARDTVDPRYWSSPVFRSKNRAISAMWAGVALAMALCHLVAGTIAAASVANGNYPGNLLLNWVVPIALIVWAIKRTSTIADDISFHPTQ